MNAQLELSHDATLCIPSNVLTKRTPSTHPFIVTANLTPMHTVVDLHIDQGRDGLVQCIGGSKKIILMWPATIHNMEIMQDQSNQKMKFIRNGYCLQGGIIIVVDSSVCLVMYTGTIHMTITLEGGVLVGINWVAAEGHYAAARCFQYEIRTRLEDDISNVLGIYADQLDISLAGCDQFRHREVLEEWIIIYPLLVKACNSPTLNTTCELHRVCQTLKDSLERLQIPQRPCCGNIFDNYGQHFHDAHIKDLERLIPRGLPKKRKRS